MPPCSHMRLLQYSVVLRQIEASVTGKRRGVDHSALSSVPSHHPMVAQPTKAVGGGTHTYVRFVDAVSFISRRRRFSCDMALAAAPAKTSKTKEKKRKGAEDNPRAGGKDASGKKASTESKDPRGGKQTTGTTAALDSAKLKTAGAGKDTAKNDNPVRQKTGSGFSNFLKKRKKRSNTGTLPKDSGPQLSFLEQTIPELRSQLHQPKEKGKEQPVDKGSMFGPGGLGVLSDALYSQIDDQDNSGFVAEETAEDEENAPPSGSGDEAESNEPEEDYRHIFDERVEKQPLGEPAPDVAADIISGERWPRLTITLTDEHVYATLMDDFYRHILCSVCTRNTIALRSILPWEQSPFSKHKRLQGNTVLASWEVGKLIGRMARSKGISNARFDRAVYRYAGRAQGVARGASAVGLSVVLDTRTTVKTCKDRRERKRQRQKKQRKPEIYDPQKIFIPPKKMEEPTEDAAT
eukprot:GHVQ01012156.1.p2 GENE.GHVQ01012156.1~~GHVQ01012156.1.p2  ORF type:complete len:464 (+),score=60.78 GHVQ01012156.1:5781-7172(+)